MREHGGRIKKHSGTKVSIKAVHNRKEGSNPWVVEQTLGLKSKDILGNGAWDFPNRGFLGTLIGNGILSPGYLGFNPSRCRVDPFEHHIRLSHSMKAWLRDAFGILLMKDAYSMPFRGKF